MEELGASRVVIDSLSGFEIALAQNFRDDFRESLYRMVAALTRAGVTVLMTVEVTEEYTELRFSPHAISFLTDDLVLQRYIELDGKLQKVLTVVKMRGSDHSQGLARLRDHRPGAGGGRGDDDYRGIITGIPVRRDEAARGPAGLTDAEATVLRVLEALREGTVEQVAERAKMGQDEVRGALERVVALSYALRQDAAGEAVYRVAARSLKR